MWRVVDDDVIRRGAGDRAAAQTVGLNEAFWPLAELEEVDDSWRWYSSHGAYRLAFAATAATVLWALAQVAPGTGTARTRRPLHTK